MGKRIWLFFVIIVLTLSTGCDTLLSGLSQPKPVGPSLDEISTLSALATEANSTPTLDLSIPLMPTSTPFLDMIGQGGEATDENSSAGGINATKTIMPGEIRITGITKKSAGVAQINWETSGEFPYGYKIVYTDQQTYPTYPENTFTSIYNSNAKAGVISYVPDRIYYVRVCRVLVDSCDLYSDLGIFAFAPPTATPKPTKTPSKVVVGGTTVPYDSTLTIDIIKSASTGKAYFAWTDKSSSSKGYKIVYSSSSQIPTYGKDPYFYIADSATRSAYVDGNSNTKYYYRICRFDGSKCTAYSAVYAFTFPSYSITSTADSSTITISSINDTATGVAQVNWTASGSFPNGFKILYSKTNSLPTLADSVTVVSDGSLRLGSISGDPSATYHVRVCKYSGGECIVYSPVVDFTFAADSAVITITNLVDNATEGSIDLDWTATGTFTNGFKVLYSTSQSTPTYENASLLAISDGSTRTATVVGSENTHYYLRVCKFTGSGCGVYSNIVEFTTQTTDVVLSKDGVTPDTYNWSLPGGDADNADGYKLFWAENDSTPVWTSGLSTQESATASLRTLTLASPLSSGNYIVRLCVYSAASGGSCTAYSNTLEVVVP
ncbi:MAG: hypothetical protein CVU42_01570 [Chloroflexi bacterium HGW-Chloroflexi-4]|nr:MAG: hypothetical protein CVU42_01570 [Chloroflexi bacterium HGW-Chloroflexi-4]